MKDSVYPPDPGEPPPPPDDRLRIVYEGQAESISASKLGQALTGISSILVAAGGVEAKITEAQKSNSFSVELGLAVEPTSQVLSSEVLSSVFSSVADSLFGATGLVSSIQKIQGRQVDKVDPDADYMVLSVDEDRFRIPKQTYELLSNRSVVTSLRDVCSPLDPAEGVTAVSIHSSAGTSRLSHEHVSYMALSLPDTEYRRTLQFDAEIIQAHFMGPNNWQLHISGSPKPVRVSIVDQVFMGRVDTGEQFRKGDRIEGVMEEILRAGKQTERTVLEARHVRQRELNF